MCRDATGVSRTGACGIASIPRCVKSTRSGVTLGVPTENRYAPQPGDRLSGQPVAA